MGATNAAVHIFALLALVGLAFALLRKIKERDFVLAWLAAAREEKGQSRVTVDWPLSFVRKFARAYAIPYDGASTPKGIYASAVKMRPAALVELFLASRIVSFTASAEGLQIAVQGEVDEAQWSRSLTEALQLPVNVRKD